MPPHVLRAVASLTPRSWRRRILESLKRQYRLGSIPDLVQRRKAELDLLEMVMAHHARRGAGIRFLQVGACDGVMGDALFPLIGRYGLRGILVEPRPAMFQRLKHNYNERFESDRFIFVNAAITRTDGHAEIYSVSPEVREPDWLTGMASFDRKLLVRGLQSCGKPVSMIRSERVATMTFETIFADHALGDSIDLLQVDAEGFDAEIVRMFDVPRRKPAIVRFEHMHLDYTDYESTLEMLTGAGYKIGVSAFDTLAYRPV